jgi:SAM-dependent methyltransferase
MSVISKWRPEIAAGGFARDHGGIHFFTRVNALLSPHMTVLDFGAGRGTVFHHDSIHSNFYQDLVRMQGKVNRVIGVDVDRGINEHPFLDERHIVATDEQLPLPDGSIDLVVSDWVFEHIGDPGHFSTEMWRILRTGGWLCARTVNRWGYVGIGARLIPNTAHKSFLKKLWPERFEVDVFPTTYRLNSLSDLRKFFPAVRWESYSYLNNITPKYFGKSGALFYLISLYQKFVPYCFSTDLLVFLRKR